LDREVFLGGSLIIANHVAQFANHVTLLTAVGKECQYRSFVKTSLDTKISQELVYLEEASTLIKKRYLLKDGKTLTKLFETYSGQEKGPNYQQTAQVIRFLKERGQDFDLVISADFGNGFVNSQMIQAISEVPAFLAVNTQTNSGNRGFNVVTNYHRADYISLNEPELRLAAHDKTSSLEGLAADIAHIMDCKGMSITRGVNGILCFPSDGDPIPIPAFANQSIDRIGAGDAFLSLSSLCLSNQMPLILSGFIGSLAAAMSVQMVGNQEPIKKSALCKYLIRLMK
jgi:bifunctional ADP-heptose synthase (sugar kinase/adenylyltransferase)